MNAGAAGGAAAAAAAAEQARRMREEEEVMTAYRADDLDGWEFKILRAMTARFKDPHEFQAILAEEAQAGWELVEKFDNQRVRVKRRVDWREKDSGLPFDPYRTRIGMGQGAFVGVIVGVVLACVAVIGMIAAIATN